MVVHGETTFQLIDPKMKKVVRQIKKSNTLTGTAAQIYQTGLLADLGLNGVSSPLDFFGGIFLCDRAIGGSPVSLPAGVKLTAHAGQTAPATGDTNLKRGTPNLTESGPLTNGYRRVWDWSTDRALGPIGSACLTHSLNGYNGLMINESDLICKRLFTAAKSFPYYAGWVCLDPANNRYFVVLIDGTNITIDERAFSFTSCRIVEDHTLLSTRTVSTSLSLAWNNQGSCQILNGSIYVYFVPSGGHEIRICQIATSDWTVTDRTLTLNSSITLYMSGESYIMSYSKVCLHEGYFYVLSGSNYGNVNFYKINESDPTDVTLLEMESGITLEPRNSFETLLPINGYIYVLSPEDRPDLVIDTVAGTVKKSPNTWSFSGYYRSYGAANLMNNIIIIGGRERESLCETFLNPSAITTVNDLQEVITKTADLALKVIYTLTEGAA